MAAASFGEARLVTFAAIACVIAAVFWVPWYQEGLSGSAATFLRYGLLWSPAYRSMEGASISWTRVGAALASTALVWALLQLVLEPFNAAKHS